MLMIVIVGCIALHLLIMALAGKGVGVTMREFSFGVGPRIFKVGVFRLGLIPSGGYVTFKDGRLEPVPPHEAKTALDGRSGAEQIFIALSGCVVLLIVADILLGRDVVRVVASLPGQLIAGAISPFGEAQPMLAAAFALPTSAPFGTLVGVVAAKLAALNLLPFPATNGGAAIVVLARRLGADAWWPPAATNALLFVSLALQASWIVALLVFLFTS